MKLTIKITSSNIELEATYTRGKLRQITLKKGKMNDIFWMEIGKIVPPMIEQLEEFKQRLKNTSVEFFTSEKEVKGGEALYNDFLKTWFEFYEGFTGIKPRFNATDGKCLKQIIAYFRQVCQSDEETLSTWQVLLSNWQKLDKFHQKNTDLKYINGSLNKILQNAKQQTSGGSTTYSDSFKREIFKALQSS